MASTSKKILFNEAVAKLSKINGLYDLRDLTSELAMPLLRKRSGNNGNISTEVLRESELEAKIIDLFLNTYQGGITTSKLIEELNTLSADNSQNSEELIEQIFRSFNVIYSGNQYKNLIPSQYKEDFQNVSINTILGYPEGQDVSNKINTNINNPTKESPGLGVILSNNYMIGLNRRDANPTTVFLNNIPNIEMNRCTPFVDIKIIQGRPMIHEPSKKLQAISLGKFLLGAEKTEPGSLKSAILNAMPTELANISSLSGKSVAGMELFTAPQTLVNANESYNSSIRSNEVLDKFVPFLTLNDMTLNVVPSTGLMSYKSGQISMTLHDRSRLSEIADFIRVDLYGTTELLIEYGWIHPDGEQYYQQSTEGVRNPYGDLINGMRLTELYHIVNSSFSLTESGQVSINLQIAMRGGTDFSIALIGSDSENSNSIIRDIQRLQRDISELRGRIFDNQNQDSISEIRGIQILDSARDAMNFLSMPSSVTNQLRQFEQQLRQTEIPGTDELLSKLKELFEQTDVRARGRVNSNGGSSTSQSLITQLRRTVQDSVKRKIDKLASTPDPMLIDDQGHVIRDNTPGRILGNSTAQSRREIEELRRRYSIDGVQNISVSLGKILLFFIGEPLANTNRYDDVQLVFYPFNIYAGRASGKNIANFAVDLEYFTENFFRWRLERMGQSNNVNLNEFMSFIQETIIDDCAARSYGLYDTRGALFRTTVTDDGNALGVEAIDSPAVHMDRMNRLLAKYTPNGEFRLPQIEFFVETLPEQRSQEQENSDSSQTISDGSKSILRIHIFDRITTPYDSLGALLSANRNSEITALGTIAHSADRNDNEGVANSMARVWNEVVAAADRMNLLERVPNTGTGQTIINQQELSTAPARYRIAGGPAAIKNFLYDTMPYIRFGNIGSNVTNANLTSINEPQLNTVNLLRSFRRSDLEPNGELPGGLPMQIIPTETNMTTFGCPLINFAQQFFIDFQTGTTADNIYGVVGVTHKFAPGTFTTDIKFCPLDAYGKYFNLVDQLQNAITELEDINNRQNGGGSSS